MKRLFFYVILLILAVWLGLLLKADPGYILVAYKQWTAETSLWFGILAFVVLFWVIYQAIRFINLLIASRGHISRFYQKKRFLKAHTKTGAGLLALAEGAWEEAEDLLLEGAPRSSIQVVNYINAARAAQEQLNYSKRDKYLEKALDCAVSHEKTAVFLTQARLHLEHRQFDEAQKVLEKLHEFSPRHRYTLKLLSQVYLAQRNTEKLFELLPLLKKYRVLNESDWLALSERVYEELLTDSSIDLASLKKYWKALPKHLQNDPASQALYAKKLAQLNADEDAAVLIQDMVKKNYDPFLVTLYGKLNFERYDKALHHASTWSKLYGNRSELFTTLGSLAIKADQLDLAKTYLGESLTLCESAECYQLLALLYEKTGDEKASLAALRKALQLNRVI